MPDAAVHRVLVCRVGTTRFALRLDHVREVCAEVRVIPMPAVAAAIAGVANVRGSVVTVVDGAALLGGQGGPAMSWLVVLTLRGGGIGIAVEDVEDLAAAGPGTPAPPALDLETLLGPIFAAEAA